MKRSENRIKPGSFFLRKTMAKNGCFISGAENEINKVIYFK
jgi:hypothetical protein